MLFASVGIFGVFLFLTYYLQDTLGFSPVKTGVAFLPLVATLAVDGPSVQPDPLAAYSDPSRSCRSGCSCVPWRCSGSIWWDCTRRTLATYCPISSCWESGRAERLPVLQHRHPRVGTPRRRRGIGHPQHRPTGGGIHRHGAAQHAGRECCHLLPGRSGTNPGQSPGSRASQLHHSVPLVLLDLHGRGPRCRPGATARQPDGACARTPAIAGRQWNRRSTPNTHPPRAGYLVGSASD